jgi:hypothetical protein
MKKLLFAGLLICVCLPPVAIGDDRPPAKEAEPELKILWDMSSINPSCEKGGAFEDLGEQLEAMGAEVDQLWQTQEFSDETLADVDMVIICERQEALSADEQAALVRFVRNGGSLLTMVNFTYHGWNVNPVLANFGIQYSGTYTEYSYMDMFEHPASSGWSEVEKCEVRNPIIIDLAGRADAIGGRAIDPDSESIDDCIMALGCNTGEGRVIAVGDSDLWCSANVLAPAIGKYRFPLLSKGDNSKTLGNASAFLLGASDLKLIFLKCKHTATPGGKLKLKTKVQNMEFFFSNHAEIGFFLVPNSMAPNGTPVELGRTDISELRGRRKSRVGLSVDIPEGIAPGEYTVQAIINPDAHILEANEENNIAEVDVEIK